MQDKYNKQVFLKEFLDLVKSILLVVLTLDAPLLGHLDLLLGAVLPGFVPTGLVVSLPALLLGVLLTELLGFRPAPLVRNVNTALAGFVPTIVNWSLPAFLDILALLVVRSVRGVRGGRVLHSRDLGCNLCSDLLAESFLEESLAQQVLTEQMKVEKVDAAFLPAGSITQSGHSGLCVALQFLGDLQQLRGGDVLQSLSQGLLIDVIQELVVIIMFMVMISGPLGMAAG